MAVTCTVIATKILKLFNLSETLLTPRAFQYVLYLLECGESNKHTVYVKWTTMLQYIWIYKYNMTDQQLC